VIRFGLLRKKREKFPFCVLLSTTNFSNMASLPAWAHISGRRNSELLRVKPLLLYSKCGGWNPEWLGVSASWDVGPGQKEWKLRVLLLHTIRFAPAPDLEENCRSNSVSKSLKFRWIDGMVVLSLIRGHRFQYNQVYNLISWGGYSSYTLFNNATAIAHSKIVKIYSILRCFKEITVNSRIFCL
jgi:hypothetical protein